ncbi:MAG TPA: lipid II flippase MurJ [Patescibacteria group bacterium]|nr:lipid II flippase MurJ [Patescibacteria group bacterium]
MILVRRFVDRVFPRGALILSILSFGYFAAGIVRNRILATEFGAGAELDAYNAAFRIPEIALDILVASGLSAPFVPIFSRLLGHDDPAGRAAAEEFGQTILTGAVAVMTVAVVLLFIFAPWIADTVWRDFDPSTKALYVNLLRINCVAQVMFAASNTVGDVLVVHRRFLLYGLAPIAYTTGIVIGAILLGPSIGIYGPAIGAVGGATGHLAIRIIGGRQVGFRIRPSVRFRTSAFREFFRLMLPRMASYPIDPIVVSFMTVLAVALGPGTASALSYVLDYQFVPIQVIAIAFSLAVFPVLSRAYADGDGEAFRRILVRNVVTIGGLTVLAAIVLAILARPLVSILLGGGRFGPDAVALTSGLLLAFTISIPIDALSYPLSRALYATHNTIWQVTASITGLATLVVASQILVPAMGVGGIAVGYAIGGAAKIAILTIAVVRRVRPIGRGRTDVPAV